MSDAPIRRLVRIRGCVQGVGFRAHVLRVAALRPVVGTVRNRRDGSVEATAQGAPEAVVAFVDALAARLPHGARIDAIEIADVEPDPSLVGFATLSTEM